MANPYPGTNIPTARPTIRKIDIRSLSYALAGPVPPYPVYEWSHGVVKIEYDRHNPFYGENTNNNP